MKCDATTETAGAKAEEEEEEEGGVLDNLGYLQLGLPRAAEGAFRSFRSAYLKALPAGLRAKCCHPLPDPHITLFYGCTGNPGNAMTIAQMTARVRLKADTMSASFGPAVVVGSRSPVLLVPIHAPRLVDLFHALYADPEFNPAGDKCGMGLIADKVSTDNPLGYDVHATLAWFEEGTDLSAAPTDLPSLPSLASSFNIHMASLTFDDA